MPRYRPYYLLYTHWLQVKVTPFLFINQTASSELRHIESSFVEWSPTGTCFFILHSGRFTIYLTLDSIKGFNEPWYPLLLLRVRTSVDTRDLHSVDASTNTGTLLYIIFH